MPPRAGKEAEQHARQIDYSYRNELGSEDGTREDGGAGGGAWAPGRLARWQWALPLVDTEKKHEYVMTRKPE
jgi:hypothetical protein